jgi:hypothetical protein
MLVSQSQRVAFAHYPKTAGSSLQRWFLDAFPDAALLVADNPHLPVAESLQMLRPRRWQRRLHRLRSRAIKLLAPAVGTRPMAAPGGLRIVGAIREPFEMLVSLFEFWQREPFATPPTDPFINCARHGRFRDFLAAAVIGGRVDPYERFFDVGGPAWPETVLLDFASIEPALRTLSADLGIPRPKPLPQLNRAPAGHRDLDGFRDEAGPLLAEVRRHFRWYYEEGVYIMLRGEQPGLARAA